MKFNFCICGVVSVILNGYFVIVNCINQKFQQQREKFLKMEQELDFGEQMKLNDLEKKANEIIMNAKAEEYEKGFRNPHNFIPSRPIFEVLDQINSSKLFNILQKMPKGAILHAHDTALCSTDYIMSLTYKENLWQCYNFRLVQLEFRFSLTEPEPIEGSIWVRVADERSEMGQEKYDNYVRSMLTLNSGTVFKDINDVWTHFMLKFILVTPLITYKPVFKEYFKQALQEIYEDGIQYLEFRGTIPPVYDLDGNTFSAIDVIQMYKNVNDEFIREHPDFLGSKFIYAPIRNGNISQHIETLKVIHEKFPTFIAGFDLVGQEDKGPPLIDMIAPLLSLPKTINFFFHAGETNWYGTPSDENLIDAVLLGTKRIGHGFALLKHPKVMETIITEGIAIEINPISNQVLKLVNDYRNHPCAVLLANNFPVVISSDDPSFWGVTPLTHDFYEAFLGIASKRHNLSVLKKLAFNSIFYSSLEFEDKMAALNKWLTLWHQWIKNLITS